MKKILNKILDEINKETPRLDYIRGLIEASLEEGELNKPNTILNVNGAPVIVSKDFAAESVSDTSLPPVNLNNVIKDSIETT